MAARLSGRHRAGCRNPGHIPTGELAKLVQDRQRVIYGIDNRRDLYQVKSTNVRAVADAVVALVKAADLVRQSDGSYKLTTEPYQEAYQLCGNEPFVSQPIGCFCSGCLVRPDVVTTAGHGVKSQSDLGNMRLVFGFRMLDRIRRAPAFLPTTSTRASS